MAEIERLDVLAKRINEEHRRCEGAVSAALEHAMNAGDLLSEAKAGLPHGAFGAWLAENFAGSDRTARAYMRVASHRGDLEANRQGSATLSLDGALRALATPKDAAPADRPATLEEREARAEAALSKSRAGALGTAESLDAINRGRGWEALGYATFADYVTGEFADHAPFPIPYEVISDEAGEPLPVFAMAEQIHAWGIAHVIAPLLHEDETGRTP
jgi:Protein of unknown function (DUF3102)